MESIEKQMEIYVNGAHEFNYIETTSAEGVVHTLLYSNNQSWSSHIRETLAGRLIDDDNGYRIEGSAKLDKKGKIEYSNATILEILIRIANLEENYVYEMLPPSNKIRI
jgi:hypothetical protein